MTVHPSDLVRHSGASRNISNAFSIVRDGRVEDAALRGEVRLGRQQPARTLSRLPSRPGCERSLSPVLVLLFIRDKQQVEPRKRYINVEGASNAQTASNPFFDMAAALEWSAQVAEEAGPEFAEAVEWCLKNMPGSGKSDGMPDKWRKELFEKVVVPLQYCCDQFAC